MFIDIYHSVQDVRILIFEKKLLESSTWAGHVSSANLSQGHEGTVFAEIHYDQAGQEGDDLVSELPDIKLRHCALK